MIGNAGTRNELKQEGINMKRRVWIAFIIMLAALMLCVPAVCEQNDREYVLDSQIENLYQSHKDAKEMEEQGNQNQAKAKFNEVINNYEKNSYGTFRDAAEYYNYAKGWIAFSEGRYENALDYFSYCSDDKFPDTVYYQYFIQGVYADERGDLENAKTYFEKARKHQLLSGKANEHLRQINQKLKEQEEQNRLEAARLAAEEEERKKNEDLKAARQAVVLSFDVKKETSGGKAAVKITWKNPLELNSYYVTVSSRAEEPDPDMFSAGTAVTGSRAEWKPDGNGCSVFVVETKASSASLTVTGLWKGTKYYIRVYDRQFIAQSVCNTVVTDKYPATEEYFGDGDGIRLFSTDKDAYLRAVKDIDGGVNAGCSPAIVLYNSNASAKVNDRCVVASKEWLSENGYFLQVAISVDPLKPDSFDNKDMEIYLHIDNCGTVRLKGTGPLDEVRFLAGDYSGFMFTVYLGGLFDMFDEIPAGVEWNTDLVVDEKIALSFGGMTK